jgi:hypothetical protein
MFCNELITMRDGPLSPKHGAPKVADGVDGFHIWRLAVKFI